MTKLEEKNTQNDCTLLDSYILKITILNLPLRKEQPFHYYKFQVN